MDSRVKNLRTANDVCQITVENLELLGGVCRDGGCVINSSFASFGSSDDMLLYIYSGCVWSEVNIGKDQWQDSNKFH